LVRFTDAVLSACGLGSAEQRVHWFRRGLDTGDLDACDSFAAGAV
jgi:predicted metalloprotease